ncbi:DUF11 domain-containing protein, partial [Candidatus Woesearchaeota archaeon]|nr:DUF11 domain-containing protein [Candidatus Woesearchaeota archaeon]
MRIDKRQSVDQRRLNRDVSFLVIALLLLSVFFVSFEPPYSPTGYAPIDCPGNQVIICCHKPGTPAEQTKCVTEKALSAHLKHGDIIGPCLPIPKINITKSDNPDHVFNGSLLNYTILVSNFGSVTAYNVTVV